MYATDASIYRLNPLQCLPEIPRIKKKPFGRGLTKNKITNCLRGGLGTSLRGKRLRESMITVIFQNTMNQLVGNKRS